MNIKKIQLQNKRIYQNKTLKYLFNTTKTYGSKFISLINKCHKMAVCVGDINHGIGNLYILFDTNGAKQYDFYKDIVEARSNLINFISFVKEKEYFIDEYIYGDPVFDTYHMVVLKLPVINLETFINGEYSNLFSEEEINNFFKKVIIKNDLEVENDVYSVLVKNPTYKTIFSKIVEEDFRVKTLDFKEYDYPPLLHQEIFGFERRNKEHFRTYRQLNRQKMGVDSTDGV